jgi:hypothetical protein
MFKFAVITFAALLSVASLVGSAQAASAPAVPDWKVDRVSAHSTNLFNVQIWEGETTEIQINGDGDTDLDLIVYDGRGREVGRSDSYSDSESVSITAAYNDVLTVKVINLGSVYNEFVISTR